MDNSPEVPPRVFISYSHDSPEHEDRVLALANRLIEDGVNCILDQHEPHPAEDWPLWMDRQVRDAIFVAMICTPTYYRRVMGEEEPGKGRGVRWEGRLIYNESYIADRLKTKFIPLLFNDADLSHIPRPFQGTTHHYIETEDGYEDLYRHITGQPRHEKPQLGKLKRLPPKERSQDFLHITSLAVPPNSSKDESMPGNRQLGTLRLLEIPGHSEILIRDSKGKEHHLPFNLPRVAPRITKDILINAPSWKRIHTISEILYAQFYMPLHLEMTLCEKSVALRCFSEADIHKQDAQRHLNRSRPRIKELSSGLADLPRSFSKAKHVTVLQKLPLCTEAIAQGLGFEYKTQEFKNVGLLVEHICNWLLEILHIADQNLESYFRENARV